METNISQTTLSRAGTINFGLHFSCSSLTGEGWADLYEEAIELTVLAESYGFTYAVAAEHHFTDDGWISAPMVLLGALAGATSKIQVGTDIIVTPLHHPIRIAEDMLVLDNLSRGRAVCGLGLGGAERDFGAYGVPFKQRVSRTEESMRALDQLMTGTPVTLEGRYHSFDGVRITPPPVRRPRPPMFYGALSEAGARRAARLADQIVMAPHVPIDELRLLRAAYEQELRDLGRANVPEILLRREIFTSLLPERLVEGTNAMQRQYSNVYSHVSRDATDKDFQEYMAARFISATPDVAAEQLQRHLDASGAGTVIFRVQLPGLDSTLIRDTVTLLGEQVLPAVRSMQQP